MKEKVSVGVIPDGNRTYQRLHQGLGLPGVYKAGAVVALSLVKTALNLPIDHLVFYALSEYDIQHRKARDLKAIFAGIREFFRLVNPLPVPVFCHGDTDHPRVKDLAALAPGLERLNAPPPLVVHMLLNYSREARITDCSRGTILPHQIDLLIRTGGQRRVSDFLLSRIGYAEIDFIKTLWPAYTSRQFCSSVKRCLEVIRERERRGGPGA